jgi:hypothetical protein
MNLPSYRTRRAAGSFHASTNRIRPHGRLRALALMAAAALASCSSTGRPVQITSDPAGAIVLINGRETGFSTPVTLDLSGSFQGPTVRVGIQLDGYETVTRVLVEGSREELVYWDDSTVFYLTGRFPLWLNGSDLLFPKTTVTGATPPRLFARLRRTTGR